MKMKKKNLLAMQIHFTKAQIASAGRVLTGTGNQLDQTKTKYHFRKSLHSHP
jgi:hypothetical protein